MNLIRCLRVSDTSNTALIRPAANTHTHTWKPWRVRCGIFFFFLLCVITQNWCSAQFLNFHIFFNKMILFISCYQGFQRSKFFFLLNGTVHWLFRQNIKKNINIQFYNFFFLLSIIFNTWGFMAHIVWYSENMEEKTAEFSKKKNKAFIVKYYKKYQLFLCILNKNH